MATILVVEDHELTRKTIHRRLSKAGHLVLESSNGMEGIEQLEKYPVDLILMDFMMKNMNDTPALCWSMVKSGGLKRRKR